MRQIGLFFLCLGLGNFIFAQEAQKNVRLSDTLTIIEKNPEKGFYNDYILFIPKETPLHQKIYLLVEPNNTGLLSDTIDVHKEHAIHLASVSSVGNNISTELNIPILVPIFPRPASQPLTYTHALDRDVMLEQTNELKRLDLQLIQMIEDSKKVLKTLEISVHEKVFMSGFSASATFINRFSFLHPDKIKALAIGGFNGELMLPQDKINEIQLDYPLGTNDFATLFGKKFDVKAYQSLPQFIYMGALDDNDAVQFDDAYSENERKIINENIGSSVQTRYVECQKLYTAAKVQPQFKTYEKIGHWTTGALHLDIIRFFMNQMQTAAK